MKPLLLNKNDIAQEFNKCFSSLPVTAPKELPHTNYDFGRDFLHDYNFTDTLFKSPLIPSKSK